MLPRLHQQDAAWPISGRGPSGATATRAAATPANRNRGKKQRSRLVLLRKPGLRQSRHQIRESMCRWIRSRNSSMFRIRSRNVNAIKNLILKVKVRIDAKENAKEQSLARSRQHQIGNGHGRSLHHRPHRVRRNAIIGTSIPESPYCCSLDSVTRSIMGMAVGRSEINHKHIQQTRIHWYVFRRPPVLDLFLFATNLTVTGIAHNLTYLQRSRMAHSFYRLKFRPRVAHESYFNPRGRRSQGCPDDQCRGLPSYNRHCMLVIMHCGFRGCPGLPS